MKNVHINSIVAYSEVGDAMGERARELYVAILVKGEALTDRQVLGLTPYTDMNAVRPRITELVRDGWLVEVGRVECPVTGKKVRQVRAVTPERRKETMAEIERARAVYPVREEQLTMEAAS